MSQDFFSGALTRWSGESAKNTHQRPTDELVLSSAVSVIAAMIDETYQAEAPGLHPGDAAVTAQAAMIAETQVGRLDRDELVELFKIAGYCMAEAKLNGRNLQLGRSLLLRCMDGSRFQQWMDRRSAARTPRLPEPEETPLDRFRKWKKTVQIRQDIFGIPGSEWQKMAEKARELREEAAKTDPKAAADEEAEFLAIFGGKP